MFVILTPIVAPLSLSPPMFSTTNTPCVNAQNVHQAIYLPLVCYVTGTTRYYKRYAFVNIPCHHFIALVAEIYLVVQQARASRLLQPYLHTSKWVVITSDLTCMPASKIHCNHFPLSLTPVCILFYACLPYIWSQAWKEVAVDKGLRRPFRYWLLVCIRGNYPSLTRGTRYD